MVLNINSLFLGPHDMKVNKEPCQSVGKSRQHYQEHLEEQKKEKKQTEKKKTVGEEIKDIQKKRRFLAATIEDLIKDAGKYIFDAAKKDFQLLEQSNDLQALFKVKEDELKESDKMEESLSIRKENIYKSLKMSYVS